MSATAVELALQGAGEVARRLGIDLRAPLVLRDSNHTTIHLRPTPLVARVATRAHMASARARLERELAVARHLADAGAPVVPPACAAPPGPHVFEHGALTLWAFVAHDAGRAPDAGRAGLAFRAVSTALATYAKPLPVFAHAVSECRALVDELATVDRLGASDRTLLDAALAEPLAWVTERSLPTRPLHGDPHLGNVLVTQQLLWTDFESVCMGPLEWDLSSLPQQSLARFGAHDREVLVQLRRLRSACVATWCLAAPDPSSAQRDAAAFHIARLRTALTPSPAASRRIRPSRSSRE